MSNNSSNRINVPEARQALSNMKYEIANEMGINLDVYKRQAADLTKLSHLYDTSVKADALSSYQTAQL